MTSIGRSAFHRCRKLTSVIIPDGVNGIGVRAFYYCTALTNITIPNSVTTIGESAFRSCSSLVGAIINHGVSSIESGKFYACTSLTSVTIPNSVTSIGDLAFDSCRSLSSVTIPDRVTSIAHQAFRYSGSVTSIAIPLSVTSIGVYAFLDCHNVTAIELDRLNPAYSSFEGVLFDQDRQTLIQFPAGKAGSYRLPDGVTSINDQAFLDSYNLSKVTFPASLAILPLYQFRSPNLTGIYFEGDAPTPQLMGDTWARNGNKWTRLTQQGPALWVFGIAFDSNRAMTTDATWLCSSAGRMHAGPRRGTPGSLTALSGDKWPPMARQEDGHTRFWDTTRSVA